MFDGPGAGLTILFMSSILGCVILGGVWLLYACHCFLHVLTESSTGVDDIRFPGELFFEWWWKPVVCVGLLAFWLMVGGITLAPFFVTGPIAFAVFLGVFVWLLYPTSLFSALHSQNWFNVVDLALLARLGRHFGPFVFVALLTLPLVALAAASLFGMVTHRFAWFAAAGVLIPIALLFYARAWGRLAWLVLNASEKRSREKNPNPKGTIVDAQDPWAAPKPAEVPELDVEVEEPSFVDENEPEWSERHTPFGIVPEEAVKASRAPKAERRRDEPTPGNEPGESMSDYYAAQEKRDLLRRARAEGVSVEELTTKKKRKATFGSAFGGELFLYLFYPTTLRAGFNLMLLTMIELGLVIMAIQTSPIQR